MNYKEKCFCFIVCLWFKVCVGLNFVESGSVDGTDHMIKNESLKAENHNSGFVLDVDCQSDSLGIQGRLTHFYSLEF